MLVKLLPLFDIPFSSSPCISSWNFANLESLTGIRLIILTLSSLVLLIITPEPSSFLATASSSLESVGSCPVPVPIKRK